MKRYLRRGLALLLAACLLLGMAGCTEKYYNGGKAVIAMESSTESEVDSAVSKINRILKEGTLEDLIAQLPKEAGEAEVNLTNGWSQWQEILAQHGELKNTSVIDRFYYCYAGAAVVNYEFEDITMSADMLFTSDYNLVYLDFYESALSAEAAYTLPEGLEEKTVKIGEGTEYELEGTLTYPKDGTNLPAVVLVHGVGANDRDETALATKMFRDLANGLAQQGIAVLRYDKRSYTYPEGYSITDLDTLTIDFQTIDDAVLATEVLRKQSCVDPEQVYMIGHDLGGYVAPRIDLQADYAGYAMIAVPSREWSEAAYDQTIRYGMNGMEAETAKYLEPMRKSEIESIRKVDTLEDDKMTTVMLNQYAYFWKDLNAYDYPQMVADTDKPVMILQGGADYQIEADVDYTGWQEKLAGKSNVVMKLYDGLNHMMMQPEGLYGDVTKQYARPLHVADEVIADLSQWILTQSDR